MVLPRPYPPTEIDYEDWDTVLAAIEWQPYGYLIYEDGTDTYAKNGETMVIDYGGPDDEGNVDGADAGAVIQATFGEGLIYIKNGTYEITQAIEPRGNTTVQGENPAATTLRLADGADCNIFDWTGDLDTCYFFTIRDLELNGNKANNALGSGLYNVPDGAGKLADCHINHCFIRNFAEWGLRSNYMWGWMIKDNVIEINDKDGVYLSGASWHFTSNRLLSNGESGGYLVPTYASILGNYVADNQEEGFLLAGGGHNGELIGNTFLSNSQIEVGSRPAMWLSNNNYLLISKNTFDGDNQENYGIQIDEGYVFNRIKENIYRNHTVAPILDNGTNTILATIPGEFALSSVGGGAAAVAPVINTSPGGIDIDANDEFTHAKIPLPTEIQQVVRIKLWAHSNVVETTNNMLLRIVAHGAGSSEPWSGNAIDVVNHPSEEEGSIAQYDVLHWIVDASDDAQIGTLAAQDLIELLAVGEIAVAPDIATDALFGGYIIEFV